MPATGRRPWPRGPTRRVVVAAGAAWLAGCTLNADADHTGPDAPRSAPLPRPAPMAWVLSSGGPRGFVHVGVVKALAEMGLKPDLVVGASVGALVAVLCAGGMPAAELEAQALAFEPWQLGRLAFGARETLSGAPIAAKVDALLRARVDEPLLERLPVMAVCAVQRLADRTAIGFSRGRAGLAVQAASAVEGRFAPVRIRGRRYADADLVMPLPVRLARELGARRVLAVDASAHEESAPPGTERWRAGDLRKRELTRPDAALADLLLHPDTGYYAGMSKAYRAHCIEVGYRDTMAARDRIVALHAGARLPAAAPARRWPAVDPSRGPRNTHAA
jgi:NTE family protein